MGLDDGGLAASVGRCHMWSCVPGPGWGASSSVCRRGALPLFIFLFPGNTHRRKALQYRFGPDETRARGLGVHGSRWFEEAAARSFDFSFPSALSSLRCRNLRCPKRPWLGFYYFYMAARVTWWRGERALSKPTSSPAKSCPEADMSPATLSSPGL